MKCAVYQFNPTVGALESNTSRLIQAITVSIDKGCDIFIASELAVCGYIPKDLLFRPDFQRQIQNQLERFLEIYGITILIGAPYIEGGNCYNSVYVIRNGEIINRYDKQKLPNYGVFDDCRYFTPGKSAVIFDHLGVKVGIIICEDAWYKEPVQMAKDAGAQILISINASPFNIGKYDERLSVARTRVNEVNIPLIYINQLGGQDDIVYDGASFILNAEGTLIAQFPAFSQELNFCSFELSDGSIIANTDFFTDSRQFHPYPDVAQSVYAALVLATHDYVNKNGFRGVLLGLSGGVDSALTLAIACDALGADKVLAVMMPSKYTADISIIDSRDMVKRLGVVYEEIEIGLIFDQFKKQLAPVFSDLSALGTGVENVNDTTEENLQARSRGVLLMALSNKLGYLVLTTGNKSEVAVGYATLYGDMAGGFAVLRDVYKTMVYKLCNWRNTQSEIIPKRILTRAPSAELRANQTDQDSLPDYDTLDTILDLLVEQKLSSEQIISRGFNQSDVIKIARLIKLNEYKRSQAAIGPRITTCAFGNDWRYPITNHFQL